MSWLLAVPLLPAAAGVLILALGRRLPNGGGELLAAACAAALGLVLLLAPEHPHASALWYVSGGYALSVGLTLDTLAALFASVVSGVSFAVTLYALGYMNKNAGRVRFFATLSFFIAAMLTLVLSDGFLLLFAAWELVGLASYMLIGFNGGPKSRGAADRAFLATRAADMGLLLAWLLLLPAYGGVSFTAVSGGLAGLLPTLPLLALVGAAGKSAQLPFSAWLPGAMSAPTPVSALLHSATMVAAGVFLVLRIYPAFAQTDAGLQALMWVGGSTALVCGLLASRADDLKRALAWSTSAQLGEMLVAAGLGGPYAAALHFSAHAVFKSTLFCAAGVVQEQAGTRDMRRLGGLIRTMPLTGAAFVLAAVSLAGIPPLSGFWSGEAMLKTAEANAGAAPWLLVVVVGLSGFYIGRATSLTFLGQVRDARAPQDAPATMLWGMGLLAMGAVALGGYLARLRPDLLAFAPPPVGSLSGSVIGVGAALAGLCAGVSASVRRTWMWLSEKPLGLLEDGVEGLLTWPGPVVGALADVVERLERALDHVAGDGARRLAQIQWVERLETALDAAATHVGRLVGWGARATEGAEARGFGSGGDALAVGMAVGGSALLRLESGRLYLYTLGLFAWAVGALAVGVALLLPR